MELRPKIVKLAKMVGGIAGAINKIDENAPEYYALACVVSDEQADVALCMGLRKPRTVEYVAKKCGKSVEDTRRLMMELAQIGVCKVWHEKGQELFFVNIFAPGILEWMVNNREQLKAHPEIGRAFEEYTRKRLATMSPLFPEGMAMMRVIPVESAIENLPDVEPWEKISYYLEKYDQFAIGDCSCRAARRIRDEGCGHLEHNVCLQIGPSAEYYVRTGRATPVTKEEAKEILRNAELNGLMHEMPHTDGLGESDAICNCCGCSCFSLRIANMFKAPEAIRSNFQAVTDSEKCVACGQCVETCPTNALRLGQRLCAKEAITAPSERKVIDHTWSEKDWNKDYRTNRTDVSIEGTAPCKTACPAHIAVQGYLRLAAQGKYRDALALIKKENPFPAVCGRICNHRCETECTRGTVDEAVAIDEVKRFIADQDLSADTRYIPPIRNTVMVPYPQKIAIIGGGPAGMSCAFFLAEQGYRPTVFEKASRPGGMLMNGIPSFRLEKDVVQAEIDILMEMGVEFKCGVEVGKDVTIQQLREQGYVGFYVAVGLQNGGKLNIPGDDADGVMAGIDFTKKVNLEGPQQLSGNVVVIGGGNIAADVARTAARCGADSVSLYCLESYEEMPMGEEDRGECEKDGISIHAGWGPVKITAEDGKCAGITFHKCLQVKNDEGRFAPIYDENGLETVDCTTVLYCIGQKTDWGQLLAGTKVAFNPNGTVKADPVTYQTAEPDIFAGGDAYTGQKFAIDAIAAGKEGAISLHRWVQPGQDLVSGRDRLDYRAFNKQNVLVPIDSFDRSSRQQPGYNAAKAKTFGDARVTFTEEQIKKETARCLGCGAVQLNEYMCVGCGLCTTRCQFDAIHLKRRSDTVPGFYEELPIKFAKNVVKRSGRIVSTAIKERTEKG